MANDPHNLARTVQLSPGATQGYTHAGTQTEESAQKASELLTLNHARYHVRWSHTFHNHIAHHLLTIWALGASPEVIQAMFDYNTPYQDPSERPHTAVSTYRDLQDPAVFGRCLGEHDCYVDFLRFFEDEVAEKGVPAVINEYLLKGDERADDLFGRMHADLMHPIIHLGCGLEFSQPSIVAEALAQGCIHPNWPKTFLRATEEHIRSNRDPDPDRDGDMPAPSTPILEILDSMRRDRAIADAVRDADGLNKIPDGLLKRVPADYLARHHLGRFRVAPAPAELRRKTAEMVYTSAYVLGAAQRPGKREKLDFVALHCVTLAVFYPAMLHELAWLTDAQKARLLEAKVRVDAVVYAGCGCPALYPERITEYVPRRPADGWPELVRRAVVYRDEGHAAKLIRALLCLEQLAEPVPDGFPIAKRDFIKIAHMAMDSIEAALEPGGSTMPEEAARAMTESVGRGGEMIAKNMKRWVYYNGLESAWQYVPAKGEPRA
ncbi:uncharacterized protein B0T15DRAFT_245526 [Chaetomium strumarium]|uniref:Oxidoreductase AflY n=1 Tax=Chaetomium strumarium TaxID=1170767 RepID=A0AAJ0M0K6_9PEZI|nr:hypothetical protein B0T15DRAFT_245526 [Chaetomium strumarium]